MPKVLEYNPPWISQPSPGFAVFTPKDNSSSESATANGVYPAQTNGTGSLEPYMGPKRLLAQRGTETYVVVDNQIRWSDLCMVKEEYEKGRKSGRRRGKWKTNEGRNGEQAHQYPDRLGNAYIILRTGVPLPIRSISISPTGAYLAIATSHTLNVALLPDSSQFNLGQESLKLRTFTIGSTTHVLNRSALSSVLWHPCGISGSCLVSITTDAIVRLWEFDPKNRWSFDSSSLAIDLKKLAKGQTSQDDFSPPKDSSNRTFSAENVDLEVASACFGGIAGKQEAVWSAMTLWIATKYGTVYALCPLLPNKWCSSARALKSLTWSKSVAVAALESDEAAPKQELQQSQSQLEWSRDLDEQEPRTITVSVGSEPLEAYARPNILGSVPKLQGPFSIVPEESEEDIELSDIYVVPARSDDIIPVDESGAVEGDLGISSAPSLSRSLVCLISRIGRAYLCLDLQIVEAQWLPQRSSTFTVPDDDEVVPEDRSLIPFEVLDTLNPEDADDVEWPTITPDIISSEAFFITHSRGIDYLSTASWTRNLQDELLSESSEGLAVRVDVVRNSNNTLREEILRFDPDMQDGFHSSPSAPVILQDSDLGYLTLTTRGSVPYLTFLDNPASAVEQPFIKSEPDSGISDLDQFHGRQFSASGAHFLPPHPRRAVYMPPKNFSKESALPRYLNSQTSALPSAEGNKQLRLSSATLEMLSSVHRSTSSEAADLGTSVADLFVACHRLQEGLRDQIGSVRDLNQRISRVIGRDSDAYAGRDGGAGTKEDVEDRVERVKSKQEDLVHRLEALKQNVNKLNGQGKALSREEEKWMRDIKNVADATWGRDGARQITDSNDGNPLENESEEDDHMLPHRRAKAVPESAGGSSSSEDEHEDVEEEEGDGGCLPRGSISQSLQARYKQAYDLAHALHQQIPQESTFGDSTASYASTMSNGTSINGRAEELHVPRDIKRRRMREVLAMLDRETALVDATMGRLERLEAATASI